MSTIDPQEDDLPGEIINLDVEVVPPVLAEELVDDIKLDDTEIINDIETADVTTADDTHQQDQYSPPEGIFFDPAERDISVSESTGYLKGVQDAGEAILSLTRTTLGDILSRADSNDYTSEDLARIHGSADLVARWESAVANSVQVGCPERDRNYKRSKRPGSAWTQTPSYEGKNILANRPRIGGTAGTELLTGESAILYMTAMTTPGAHLSVPLWNTGIWVTMKQPSLSADTEFVQRLLNERVSLGRSTRGVLFSNDNIFTIGFLYDYILAHIFQTTAKVENMTGLRDIILSTDLPTLAWGMALLLNPNGFPFSQPCTFDPTKCVYVAEDMIAISKMLWVDSSMLSEAQLKHMATRARNVEPKALAAYQEEFIVNSGDRKVSNVVDLVVTRTDGVVNKTHLVLHVPTLEAQIQIGRQWIQDIVVMTERAFGEKLVGQNRDIYMANQARNTACRKYSHWVKEIVFTKGEVQNRIVDRDSIEASLQVITANKEVFSKYMKGIDDFIEDQSVSIIGFPNYACPACGQHHLTPEPRQTIVPIDPVSVFLALQRYRLESTLLE